MVGSGCVFERVCELKLPSLLGYLYVFSNCVEPFKRVALEKAGVILAWFCRVIVCRVTLSERLVYVWQGYF